MKSGSALFLSLFIFFMSFLAQSGLSFSDSSSTSISSEAPISYAQPIAGCGEGPVGHPCHFGHLGGCAPIQVGDGFFLYTVRESSGHRLELLRLGQVRLDRFNHDLRDGLFHVYRGSLQRLAKLARHVDRHGHKVAGSERASARSQVRASLIHLSLFLSTERCSYSLSLLTKM